MEEEEYRVAVVGGGLAGISAAQCLSSRFGKESVVKLEAASCLGGRIRSMHGLVPWPVKIGAEFLLGSHNSLRRILPLCAKRAQFLYPLLNCKRKRFSAYLVSYHMLQISSKEQCASRTLDGHLVESFIEANKHPSESLKKLIQRSSFGRSCTFFDRISPDYYDIGPERRLLSREEADEHPDVQLVHGIFSILNADILMGPDISMAEYLRLKSINYTVMQLAEATYGNDFGCSLGKLGVHECTQEAQHWTYGDAYLILDRPLLSVVACMSKDLSVRLNWVVNEVERLAYNKLHLHGQDGELVKADNVILAVPTVLQHYAITSNPALPDWKLQAARAIGMSNVVKVSFAFCHPFWPEGFFDVVCLGCFLPEMWITEYPRPQGTEKEPAANSSHQQPLGQHVVVGFVAGNAADALIELSEAEVFKSGLAQLDEMSGKSEVSGISHGGQEGISNSIDMPRVSQEENLRYKEQKGHRSSCFTTLCNWRDQNYSSQKVISSEILRGT